MFVVLIILYTWSAALYRSDRMNDLLADLYQSHFHSNVLKQWKREVNIVREFIINQQKLINNLYHKRELIFVKCCILIWLCCDYCVFFLFFFALKHLRRKDMATSCRSARYASVYIRIVHQSSYLIDIKAIIKTL